MQELALVESIPGWLRPEDAQKLYELAFSASGPVLEVGTYKGKSAVLMATAIRDAGRRELIYTLDVNRASIKAAAAQAEARGLAEAIVFVHGTVAAFARAYPQLRPGLVFIDGDHSRAGVERDLAVLHQIVPAGGRLLFHDFNDPLNEDASCGTIKVRPTVQTSWVFRECQFDGVFGACGLFTRRTEPGPAGSSVVELLRLDSVRDRYRHGWRHPAGRLLRRIYANR
jgi:hypothetical protein